VGVKESKQFGVVDGFSEQPEPLKALELDDELLELVAQLHFVPLTLVDELGVFATQELLLQLYAFATFGVWVS
jgi:hypothetical protein